MVANFSFNLYLLMPMGAGGRAGMTITCHAFHLIARVHSPKKFLLGGVYGPVCGGHPPSPRPTITLDNKVVVESGPHPPCCEASDMDLRKMVAHEIHQDTSRCVGSSAMADGQMHETLSSGSISNATMKWASWQSWPMGELKVFKIHPIMSYPIPRGGRNGERGMTQVSVLKNFLA